MSAILGSPTNPIEHGAPGTKIIRVLVVGPPAQLALFARKLTLALPVVDLMRRAKRGDSTTRANRSSGVGARGGGGLREDYGLLCRGVPPIRTPIRTSRLVQHNAAS